MTEKTKPAIWPVLACRDPIRIRGGYRSLGGVQSPAAPRAGSWISPSGASGFDEIGAWTEWAAIEDPEPMPQVGNMVTIERTFTDFATDVVYT